MRENKTRRVLPTDLEDVAVNADTGVGTISLGLEDGHALELVLTHEALQRLYQQISDALRQARTH